MSDKPPAGRKVLCIEDERFISELYDRVLSKAGYHVDSIVDGREALKAAQTNKYDIILLDLMLPNLSGIDILRELKDPARVPPLKAKIIVTTNLEQRDDVRADIEKQADGYVVKAELTPRELVELLDSIR
ncbi:MAG TPA: response regulator [Candidatus Saccharimonadales bacterium]|nr:response regulator [Candidatus Saccharimonadales bacterium]